MIHAIVHVYDHTHDGSTRWMDKLFNNPESGDGQIAKYIYTIYYIFAHSSPGLISEKKDSMEHIDKTNNHHF